MNLVGCFLTKLPLVFISCLVSHSPSNELKEKGVGESFSPSDLRVKSKHLTCLSELKTNRPEDKFYSHLK